MSSIAHMTSTIFSRQRPSWNSDASSCRHRLHQERFRVQTWQLSLAVELWGRRQRSVTTSLTILGLLSDASRQGLLSRKARRLGSRTQTSVQSNLKYHLARPVDSTDEIWTSKLFDSAWAQSNLFQSYPFDPSPSAHSSYCRLILKCHSLSLTYVYMYAHESFCPYMIHSPVRHQTVGLKLSFIPAT